MTPYPRMEAVLAHVRHLVGPAHVTDDGDEGGGGAGTEARCCGRGRGVARVRTAMGAAWVSSWSAAWIVEVRETEFDLI